MPPDGLATTVGGDGGNGGRPLLWIHGYTLRSSLWSELWGLLPGRTHVGLDLPYHGDSRPLDPGEDLPALGRAVVRLAGELGRPHLVAMSFGGLVAIEAAIQDPGAFTSLTLASPALGGGPEDDHGTERNQALANLYRERGPGPWMTELWMRPEPDIFTGASRRPELWRRLAAAIDRHRWDELRAGGMRALAERVHTPGELSRVDPPALVLIGDEDMPAYKRTGELLRRALPACRREYVPDAGHLCALEEPDWVAERIESFISAAERAADRSEGSMV